MTTVARFVPEEELKPFTIIVAIGKRNTGKSVLIRDIMYHLHRVAPVEVALAFTPTVSSMQEFAKCIPSAFLYQAMDPDLVERIVAQQTDDAERGQAQHLLIVMDDMMYDKNVLKGPHMRNVFMNGRHYRITLVVAMQYMMDMTPDLRSQVDYVFSLKETSRVNREKMFHAFYGVVPTISLFNKTLDQCTKNHECLVAVNNSQDDGLASLRWYKAALDVPDYQLCSARYWILSGLSERQAEGGSDCERKVR